MRSGKVIAARRERNATRGHLSTPAVGARIGPLCQEEPQREGPRRKRLRWGVRLIRSRSPLSLLFRERPELTPQPPRQEVKNRARWVGRNKRRRALGAGSSRILRHPRTLRRGVDTGALLPRQQARTKYELGGPRLHPRGAVRAGPTPESERSSCLPLPEEAVKWTSEAKPRPLRTCE